MKNILFAIALVGSLVFGSTMAFADSSAHQSGTRHTEMNKKGLSEALVVENGKDTWVLHQPKAHPLRYFLPTSEEKMTGGRNAEGQAKHQKG